MSNDSSKIPTGKPIAEGLRKEDLQTAGTGFVTWNPPTRDADMLRMITGPLLNTASKIDGTLLNLERRIERIEARQKAGTDLDCI